MGKEIRQFNLTSHGRVSLHLQQAALRVHFGGAAGFAENLAVSLLPSRFHRRDEGKTPAPPLSSCGRRLIPAWLYPGTASLNLLDRTYTTTTTQLSLQS